MEALRPFAAAAVAASLALAAPEAASAETNLLFILDGSNSMWGQVEGQPKIKSAQKVLTDLLSDLPQDTNVGLMVYGHTSKDSCDDIEIVSSLGADTPQAVAAKINGIQPKGKTPIAGALFASIIAFRGKEGGNNNIVLISDGVETCGGDVCMAASAVANAKIKPRIHVVGFDVNAEERAQLECIPEMGNGKYFSAANAKELKAAVAQVAQVVEQAPEPKKGPKEFFRDDFDGEELADHWEVLNPNPDAFIVEDGKLLVINSVVSQLANKNVENFFSLTSPVPEGDWIMTAKLRIDFQTGKEIFFLGLYRDEDNYILGKVWAPTFYNRHSALHISITKRSKGKDVNFEKSVWNDGIDHGGIPDSEIHSLIPQPILFRIRKKGRSFIVGGKLEGLKDAKWVETDKLSSLRAKGTLAFGILQAAATNGETLVNVDWIKIEVPQ